MILMQTYIDAITGEYRGSTSLLTPPVGCELVATPPPQSWRPSDSAVWRHNGTGWDDVADYRGQTWHNQETGEQVTYDALGQAPADGWAPGEAPPTEAAALEAARGAAWARIKAARDSAEYSTFYVPGLGTFDADAVSQQRITGAYAVASTTPGFETIWTLADNSSVSLDAPAMELVGRTLLDHVASAHERARVLRVQVLSATTIPDLDALSWASSA